MSMSNVHDVHVHVHVVDMDMDNHGHGHRTMDMDMDMDMESASLVACEVAQPGLGTGVGSFLVEFYLLCLGSLVYGFI